MEFNKNLIGIAGSIGSGKDTAAKIIQWLIFKDWITRTDRLPNHSNIPFELFVAYTSTMRSQYSGYEIKRFAGKLKQIVSLLTGIPVENLEKESVKSSLLGEEWSCFISLDEVIKTGTGRRPLTVREMLQRVGTDALRDKVHQNIHVNALFADYRPTNDCTQHSDGLFYTDEHGENEVTPIYPKWIIPDLRFKNEGQAINSRGGICLLINNDRVTKGTHASENDLNDWNGFYACIDNSGTMTDFIEGIALVLRTLDIIK